MAKPRIGFIGDFRLVERPGSAQEVVEQLLLARGDVDLVECPPSRVDPTCDAFVFGGNWSRYSDPEMEAATAKPYVVNVLGWWEENTPVQTKWRAPLLEGARRVFFSSPLHKKRFQTLWKVPSDESKVSVLPYPIKGGLLKQVAMAENRPFDALWIGEIHPLSGLDLVVRWADQNKRELHIYGIGPPQGETPYAKYRGMFPLGQRISILSQYRTFVRFPKRPEPFGLCVMEAYLAGLEVIVTGRIGCLSFDVSLDELAEMCETSAEKFWVETQEALS